MSATAPQAPRPGRVRAAVRRLLTEHASPAALGWAVAVGVFVGCSPLYGLQMLLCLLLAWLLRLNKVATLVGVQVSLPPVTAVILFAEVQVGEYLLRGRFLELSPRAFRGLEAMAIARSVLGAWVLGSLIVGAVLGALLGLLTYAVARRRGARPR